MAEILSFGLGTVILLAALVWGVSRYNRRNRANEPVTNAATVELYKNPERYEDGKREELQRQLKP